MYNLPEHYTPRLTPAYFEDVLDDSAKWQADVYRLAADLARGNGIKYLIDLGCGRAEKLISYAKDFRISGIDFGLNIEHAQSLNIPGSVFAACDLNTKVIPAGVFTDSVVICADVIEHLPTPDALLQTFKNACETAAFVLVSTPDRNRIYKGEPHYGPPGNPWHCREWTNQELYNWFVEEGLPVLWHGWTISNDARPDQVWTSLLVMSKTSMMPLLPARYESAEWNPVLE